MKKLTILLLTVITFFGFTHVFAGQGTYVYEFETNDGVGWNLDTGQYETDVTLSSTNRMLINEATLNMQLSIPNLNFSHLIFFDKFNNYIGYINGNGSTYQNEYYLGYDASALTTYPSSAKSFAFQNYDYDDYRALVPEKELSEKPSKNIFDNIFTSETVGLTYSFINHASFSIIGTGSAQIDLVSLFPNIVFLEETQYTFSGLHMEDSTLDTRLRITYTDDTFDNFPNPSTVESSFSITSDFGKTIDFISYTYDNTGGETTYKNIQLEIGTTATTFEPFVSDSTWNTYQNLSYLDIIGTATKHGGSNNLIENGNFAIDTDLNGIADYWYATSGNSYNFSVSNNKQYWTPTVSNAWSASIRNQTYNSISGDKYYLSLESNANIRKVVGAIGGDVTLIDNPTFNTNQLSVVYTETISNVARYLYFMPGIAETNTFIQGVRQYELTTIFGRGLEPSKTTFESYYNSWLDPLELYTTTYYDTEHLYLLSVSYAYFIDDTYTPPDAETDLDSFLTKINMNTEGGKIFLSVVIMIIVLILSGVVSKNITVAFIFGGVTFITLVAFGWLPQWTLIVTMITMVMFGLIRSRALGR